MSIHLVFLIIGFVIQVIGLNMLMNMISRGVKDPKKKRKGIILFILGTLIYVGVFLYRGLNYR